MSVDWPLETVDGIKAATKGAIAIGPFGSRMKRDCYVESGVPVIRGTNITGGPVFEGDFVYITKEKADTLGSCNVYQYDLVFPHRGSIGEVGIILEDKHFVLSSSLMKLTCDRSRVNPKFIYYFFRSHVGRHELLKNASQVGTPGIGQPLTSLKSIKFRLPPLGVQNSIESILTSLDRKIGLNRQTNQTLENIAQAIFKSWFVDFEPTRAKIAAIQNGQDPERAAMAAISGKTVKALNQLPPEQQQSLKTTAAFFPDTLAESELGEIPEGWGIQKIDDVIELAYGKALKKTNRVAGDFPVYGSGGLTGTHKEHLVKGPGIIVGRKGTVGSLYWEDRPFYPIDTVFYVKCKNRMTLVYSYYLLQTLGLENMNTDAAVPGLNRNNVYRLEMPKVPVELVKAYSILANVLREKISAGKKEILTLIELRDALLPKLLSGEIDLSGTS